MNEGLQIEEKERMLQSQSLRITSIHIVSTTGFNCIITALSFLHQHKRWNQADKAPLPWVESKLFFKKIWSTQELPFIPHGVTLDKTSSTSSKRKFKIKAQPHSIFSRRTSAFGQSLDGIRRRELDSWDALVGESN